MKRYSNVLVFTLVFTLAAFDWFLGGTTAQLGDGRLGGIGAQAPETIPADAFLTGPTAQHASFEGLEVKLERAPNARFVLVFHNPDTREHVSDLEVDCVQQTGSPMARMTPPPTVLHTERVKLTIAAGATVRRELEVEIAAPEVNREVPAFAAYTSTSFRLRRVNANADDSLLAVLRWSAG
ncbi:MAG: hypothetical protein GXP55_23320 [Deltaproteobacteria bacterium]|nr:hypothetical protein [Deltaproteobacteria bacterium]